MSKGSHLYQRVHTGPLATGYINFLSRKWTAIIILALWIALAILGLLRKQEFTNNGSLNISAPKGTEGAHANATLRKYFDPAYGNDDIVTCMARSTDSKPIVNDDVKHLAEHYVDYVKTHNNTRAEEGQKGHIDMLMTYWYLAEDLGLGDPAGQSVLNVPSKEKATAMLFTSRWTNTNVFIDARTHDLIDYYASPAGDPSPYKMNCVSKDAVLGEVLADVIDTLDFMDKVAPIGIAFFLVLILQSLTLITIPILTVICSLGASIFLCDAIATHFDLSYVSAAPAVISSFCFAFSADFTLFILARFKNALFIIGTEEQDDMESHVRAPGVDGALLDAAETPGTSSDTSDETAKEGETEEMRKLRRSRAFHHNRGLASAVYAMTTAGRNVIFSGITVLLTVATLTLIKVQFMQTLGLFLVVAIAVTILCNITVTPALLSLTPGFFQIGLRKAIRRTHDGVAPIGQRLFRSFSKIPLSLPGSIIICVLFGILLIVFGPNAVGVKHSMSYSQAIPTKSPMMDQIQAIQKEFPASTVEPINIIIEAKESLWTEKAFQDLQEFQQERITKLNFGSVAMEPNMVNSFVMAVNPLTKKFSPTPFAQADALYKGSNPLMKPYHPAYKFQVDMQTRSANGKDKNIAQLLFRPPVDPFSQDKRVEDFFRDLRNVVRKAEADGLCGEGTKWHVSHSMMDSIDGINATYKSVGIIIVLIVLFVFAVAAGAFRSIVAPLRTVVCVGTTWAIVVGGCSKFSDTMLDIDRWFWLTPLFASVLCVSIASDYDTFFSVSVNNIMREDSSISAVEAIRKSMETSTTVIMAAGMIMASAFWTLIVGSETALVKQFGIFLTATVIVDTLFVRTLLQPALMYLLGRVHWWPFGLVSSEKKQKSEGKYSKLPSEA